MSAPLQVIFPNFTSPPPSSVRANPIARGGLTCCASGNGSISKDVHRLASSAVRLGATLAVSVAVLLSPPSASALNEETAREASPLGLELKPRSALVIQESQADRDGRDYSHEDLKEALFAETSLKEADFHGADLRGGIFSRAVLYKANMRGLDATDAFFDYALLRGSDARGSIFTNANFIRADMGDMDVTDADFTDALIDNYELQGLCATATGTNPVTGADTRESLHCDSVRFYKGFNSGLRVQPK